MQHGALASNQLGHYTLEPEAWFNLPRRISPAPQKFKQFCQTVRGDKASREEWQSWARLKKAAFQKERTRCTGTVYYIKKAAVKHLNMNLNGSRFSRGNRSNHLVETQSTNTTMRSLPRNCHHANELQITAFGIYLWSLSNGQSLLLLYSLIVHCIPILPASKSKSSAFTEPPHWSHTSPCSKTAELTITNHFIYQLKSTVGRYSFAHHLVLTELECPL